MRNQSNLKNGIINDKILLREAAETEQKLSEKQYATHVKYHKDLAEWYRAMELFLNEIVTGTADIDLEAFKEKLPNITLSFDQIEDIIQLRNNPLYKRVLGLAAIQQLYDLEDDLYDKYDTLDNLRLEFDVDNKGKTFTYNGRKITAVKTPEELGAEIESLASRVNTLKEVGAITEEESQKYQKSLFHIYEYYVSIAEGEQLSFPKLSDNEYEKMKEKVNTNNISIEKQLFELIRNKRLEFNTIQNMQQEYYERTKMK